METCLYCEEIITIHPVAKHYRNCLKAKHARCKAAVGLAMVCEDVESMKNILEPVRI